MLILFFLSSGLFLGWSLGANDAANVFGTAVGTRMIRFGRAAVICSVFVVIGAVAGGAGASGTLGKLGAVNALGGSFVAALAAGLTVFAMTRLSLPVSTSQAIVGAIIGWNLFTGSLTDTNSLARIVATWVMCPVLSAVFAIVFLQLFRFASERLRLHLLWEDMLTRWLLIAVGAFGSYSLGANNIANVMGVFVPVAPFPSVDLGWGLTLSGAQLLFLMGGLAIALGVFTYSRRVMETVGGSLLRLTPQMALVVVLSQAVVLFLFASESLEGWLLARGLPTLPLVPVSSSQAVVGAVLGLGLLKGGRNVRYRVLGEIAVGWVSTPIVAGLLTFVALFFVQNVFDVPVARPTVYAVDEGVIACVERLGVPTSELLVLEGRSWSTQASLDYDLARSTGLGRAQRRAVVSAAERGRFLVDPGCVARELGSVCDEAQLAALDGLAGREYVHAWALLEDLAAAEASWRDGDDGDRLRERRLATQRAAVITALRIVEAPRDAD